MTTRNLDALLAPRSVALIGASARQGSLGLIVARNLMNGSFQGPTWLVNPKYAVIDGRPSYSSVHDLPGIPDLAVIVTPPPTVPALIDELGKKGCRSAVVITAGITADLRQAMLSAAKPYMLRIQGPNCLGLMLPLLGLNASFSHTAPPAGRLAFLSQSGALITGIVDWAAGRNIGFSHVVSLGDTADIDFGDLLDYLAGDSKSTAILLYMESLTAAPKFMSAARRAARSKPVIVLKSGRHASAAKAAQSHTGALAGTDSAYEAAFRRAGLVRVQELTELFEAAEILSRSTPLDAERLAIITNGGGAGVLAVDRLEDHGLLPATLADASVTALNAVLPVTWSHANPIDIIGDADAERYRVAVDTVLADAGADALLVMNCPTALFPSVDAARVVIESIAANARNGGKNKPVITNWLGDAAAREARQLFAKAGVPTFETPSEAIDAFAQMVRWRRAQTELMSTPPSMPDGPGEDAAAVAGIISESLRNGPRLLTEPEAKAVLSAYGIPVASTHIATTPEEAARLGSAVLSSGNAVVLKILSPDISHKSDVGGVRLSLDSEDGILSAARSMIDSVSRKLPGVRIDGFSVQPMIVKPDALELIVGMSVDRTFGPLLLFGAGGVSVEVVRDAAYALPPLDRSLARDLMQQTRIWRLMQGYRDRPPVNVDAVAEVLVRIGRLVAAHPQIRDIDINPLLADATGVIALDARIGVDDEELRPRTPFSIRPYPSEWEKYVSLAPIGAVHLRPIRPGDEPLYYAFFEKVTPGDARLRFFSSRPELSHRFLARLTQIDYSREMAFVALDGSGSLLGVVRLIIDPDFTQGEYAVLVRSDLKGMGLGWVLMEHIIAYARSAGVLKIVGDVLRANSTMIAMCREMGFGLSSDDADPALVHVALDLARRQTTP